MASPFDEQRALARGEAVARLNRGVVTVTGPDRLSWLDSMTAQSIASLAPGESAESLLLDPNGRIEHALRVVDDGTTTWLIVEADEAAALAAWLDRMRFMLRVEVADRSAEFAVVGGISPSAKDGVIWTDPWSAVQPGGVQYALGEHPAMDWRWSESIVDPGGVPADAVPAAAYDALRIAAWRPSMAEVDERSIPHELDWLRSAVHLAKGCYRGQETVAKVHNLGHPPRRLVFLHLDGSDNEYAAHGDPVLLRDEEVGTVTSAAVHYELGPIALAVVKRSTDPDAGLVVVHDGTRLAAAPQVIVPPSAGSAVEVPRLPRLGATRR